MVEFTNEDMMLDPALSFHEDRVDFFRRYRAVDSMSSVAIDPI